MSFKSHQICFVATQHLFYNSIYFAHYRRYLVIIILVVKVYFNIQSYGLASVPNVLLVVTISTVHA